MKLYHNDTDNDVCYEFIEDLGVNIFNFTHKKEISKVREKVGAHVCLLGNVPPLEVLAQGNPALVKASVNQCLESYGGNSGIILSAGGGASPGTPKENIRAMIDTVT